MILPKIQEVVENDLCIACGACIERDTDQCRRHIGTQAVVVALGNGGEAPHCSGAELLVGT